MSNKNLFIIRHGETEFNRKNIVQGSGVDTDLNETGIKQAEQFYHAYMNYPFQVVYTSALKRSQQSVMGFLQKGIPHVVMAELNEICWGDFEGKEQTQEQKEIYWQMIRSWNAGNLDLGIPNGESPNQLQERQREVLKSIVANEAENILICMHGRAMKSFLCLLLNKPLTQMEEFQHTNLCLYHLTYSAPHFTLVAANNIEHLKLRV